MLSVWGSFYSIFYTFPLFPNHYYYYKSIHNYSYNINMKVICKLDNLKKGLNIVSHIVGKSQNLPILNNVFIEAEKGALTLSTTNLEMGIRTVVRGKIEKEGTLTVPARLFNEFINNVIGETIYLESDKLNLRIKAENTNTTLKGVDPSEFPLLPHIEPQQRLLLKNEDMKKAIQQTIFAAASDTTRPELCGVLCKVEENKLYLVATDSYRLAEKKIELDKGDLIKVVVPQQTLQEVYRIFGDDEGNLEIAINENQIKFLNSSTFIISRMNEGQFPNYEQIIPGNAKMKAEVNAQKLIKAIRAASIFCRQGINDIQLRFKGNKMVLHALNDQVGESEVNLDVVIEGEEKEIVFNYHFLLDVLAVVDTPRVEIEISESNLPGVIRPQNSKDYLYIIMPIKQ